MNRLINAGRDRVKPVGPDLGRKQPVELPAALVNNGSLLNEN
jgi:hypothetical protein